MGSTSYDEARDASDPRWAGASWYGPTTGEYWIVNPREYADPRKHGPGYSSRGRTGGTPLREAPRRGGESAAPDEDATQPDIEAGTRAQHPEREWPPASDEAAGPEAAAFEGSTDASGAGSRAGEWRADPERRDADA
ncbi:MAG TPA: hypothetical protein VFW20_00450, partial [Candidatus Limnocylindrales bacterium]|nr:hypothetical protein [Candidatus Limnocylindrales bacterium]